MHRIIALALLVSPLSADDLADSIKVLRQVGPEALGNDAASEAWKLVSKAQPNQLVDLIRALDGANPLAENWLRAAVSAVDERVAAQGETPAVALADYIKNREHGAGSRTLAYELLASRAPAEAEKLTDFFADDPSASLRRYPVSKLMSEGDKLAATDKAAAIVAYKKALDSARDEDQIKPLAKKLRDLGEQVDLPKHFGFLMDWKLIAPFSNADGAGHDKVYPPEEKIDFDASYDGKGKQAKWSAFTSKDDYGKVDFNKPFGMEKEVTGYAVADFYSPEDRNAEIRLGCKNAWKVWLNGKLLFARDEYHRGAQLDQYKLPCALKKGKNVILVKCSQNHQTEEWTVEWEFQLRVCDSTGTAIPSQK
ncbi:MAG: hypothetical protein JNJ83_20805 [Verrucomicrobiaceae bacterium]|nr:hypothetical protein [Verrucomicrobiaceae bacterium]